MGIESKVRHQGDYSAMQAHECGYARVLPDYVTSLEVTNEWTGEMAARTRNLERGQVRDELHRLRDLFPAGVGYIVRAIVTEVSAQ